MSKKKKQAKQSTTIAPPPAQPNPAGVGVVTDDALLAGLTGAVAAAPVAGTKPDTKKPEAKKSAPAKATAPKAEPKAPKAPVDKKLHPFRPGCNGDVAWQHLKSILDKGKAITAKDAADGFFKVDKDEKAALNRGKQFFPFLLARGLVKKGAEKGQYVKAY